MITPLATIPNNDINIFKIVIIACAVIISMLAEKYSPIS
jgi:hypothetical protein